MTAGTGVSAAVYRGLLWMHPPAFRREFAGEMLWIFEEAAPQGVAPLLVDGLLSLLRQWLLRSGQWKLAAALIGGLVEVTAGGLGGLIFIHARLQAHLADVSVAPPPSAADVEAMNSLMHIVIWVAAGLVLMVVALVSWVRSLNRRRLSLARGPASAPERIARKRARQAEPPAPPLFAGLGSGPRGYPWR